MWHFSVQGRETKVFFLRLLSPFIKSITGFFFCTTQKAVAPVKITAIINSRLYYHKNPIKNWYHSSGWRVYRRFRRCYNEFSFNRVFMHCRHPVHTMQSIIFNKNVANGKFNFLIYYIFINQGHWRCFMYGWMNYYSIPVI